MTYPKSTSYSRKLLRLALQLALVYDSKLRTNRDGSDDGRGGNPSMSDASSEKAFVVPNNRRQAKSAKKRTFRTKRLTVDSGASVHCINDKALFETVYEDHPPVSICHSKCLCVYCSC